MSAVAQSIETDDLTMLADSARSLCAKDAAMTRLRALRGGSAGFDQALWVQMVELGWTSIQIPQSAGGLGLGVSALAAVARELGHVAAPEPLIEVAGLSASLLAQLPLQGRVAELLGQLAEGKCLPLIAWQEHPLAANEAELATRIIAANGGYRIDGQKFAVSHALVADGFLVNGWLDESYAVVWVPRTAPGVTINAQPLADGTHHATVVFNNTEISADCLLARGNTAAAALSTALNEGALLIASYLCGLMSACFEVTLKYLNTRQQFGRLIGSFQALQHRAVDLKLQCELAQIVVDDALTGLAGEDAQGQALLVSRAKYRASDAALKVVREAIQMHGAIGFTDECDVGLFVNRALTYAAALGNTQWHVQRIANLATDNDAHDGAALGQSAMPANGDWNALSDDDFRATIRHWFETNYPSELRYPPRRVRWHEIKPWYLKLSAHGLVAPAWPRQYGGMGLNPGKLLIFIEEQERWGVARAPDMGIIMVGPLLIQHGAEAQRAHYLPKILSGEYVWCQGYSEPNAGSDLASLRTEAVLDGDHFVVNGQKTWTTLAQDATHMFLLARTDKSAKKQAGISFLLIDMTTPGITVRPIRNIAGNEEFCEVFLDNVRVPKENVVGGLNQGWTIAKALLGFERIFLGSPKQSQYAFQRLTEVARHYGLLNDPAFRDRYTRFKCDVMDLESLYGRFADQVRRGEALGPEVSLLKIFATETYSKLTEWLIECVGSAGGQLAALQVGDHKVDVMSLFYTARPATIYGGSNEIQRNIISKAVLGLPD